MQKLNPNLFTYSLWKAGTLLDLGVEHNRYDCIVKRKETLIKYAIGYCNASELLIKPKLDMYAVMFQKEDLIFWTHLLKKEFETIFMGE